MLRHIAAGARRTTPPAAAVLLLGLTWLAAERGGKRHQACAPSPANEPSAAFAPRVAGGGIKQRMIGLSVIASDQLELSPNR